MTEPLSLTSLAICYLVTLLIFFAVDMLWLGLVAKSFYAEQLGSLMASEVRWGVAAGFYALYIGGIVFFASRFGLSSGSVKTAALYGAAFGFFCYATYDLTNLATLKGWPVKMVIVDIVWGTVLTAICAGGGVWVTALLTNSR